VNHCAQFGARLRRERERRNLTLEAIARHTKLSASMIASLETGLCARWPAGVYSRSYVRGYAEAVGLDPAEILDEFIRLFPHLAWTDQDRAAQVVTAPQNGAIRSAPLRLFLEEAPPPLWRRLLASLAWTLHRLATGTRQPPVPEPDAAPAWDPAPQVD